MRFCRICLMMVVFSCFFLSAAHSGNSPDKAGILQFFNEMENAWNVKDADAYMTFFHKDLKLKLGKPGQVKYYSWDEYAKILPDRIEKFGPFKMVDPAILKLEGGTAKAKVIVRKKTRDYVNVFNMVWEEGRWQISSNEW